MLFEASGAGKRAILTRVFDGEDLPANRARSQGETVWLVDQGGACRRTFVDEAASAIPCALIVMGVSGSGKSTVADKLAERIGWTYEDGDKFHPASNVAKMAPDIPSPTKTAGPGFARSRPKSTGPARQANMS